jgi:predicted dehydrogenase
MPSTRVGIIGTGLISQFQAAAYKSVTNAKIVAVCDINRPLAEQRAGEWGVDRIYTDYHELLKQPDIDAVEILLPHQLHKEVMIAAAEAHKHVSLMKPMALTSKDAKEMIAAAHRAGVTFNISENYLFYEPISRAIELVKSGDFGAPLSIMMERVPALGSSEKYAEPNEPDYWRMDKKKSGGMVFDDMVHYDAVARFLMQSDIERVSALLDHPDASYEFPAVVMWKHKGDQQYGTFTYSWILRSVIPTDYYSLHESIELICEEGMLWIPNVSAKLRTEAPILAYKEGKTTAYRDVNPDYANSFVREVQHFIDSVQAGKTPIFDGEQGHKQVLFAAAIQKSADESRAVNLSEVESA